MNPSKYIFTLDLRSVQSQITLPVTQGDTNRTLLVSFSDGAKPYILGEKSTAMMSIVRPTGTQVQEFCEVEKDGACVIYNFSEHTCIVPGLHNCQIVLYNAAGKQIAAPKFGIDAAPKLVDGDDVVIPDEDVLAFDEIYRREAVREAAEAERNEAESGRVNAEVARVAAELLRAIAERERESNAQNAIKTLNDAKTNIETLRDNGSFDGVSVSHKWEGTKLTIQSAAGTSTADLKGGKGDKGDKGDKGEDYVLTEEDVAEIIESLLEPIPNGDGVLY